MGQSLKLVSPWTQADSPCKSLDIQGFFSASGRGFSLVPSLGDATETAVFIPFSNSVTVESQMLGMPIG